MHRSRSTLTRAELAGGCRESLIDVFQRNGRERRRRGRGGGMRTFQRARIAVEGCG